jgi:membrane protein
MREASPQSPEARRKRLASVRAAFGTEVEEKLRPRLTVWEVVKRVTVGVYNDGFIHAGNLAYLSIVALFPFFILAAAVANLFGRSEDSARTVATILSELPPDVASTLRGPITEVLTARTGPLLWLGGIVGLWTAASFIETVRDILRRAYGVKYCAPFWEYRLGSIAMIFGSVVMLMFAFSASVALSSVQHAIEAWFPFSENVISTVEFYRVIPAAALFLTVYALFLALTPARYRKHGCRKWPGALLITVWWLATAEILPRIVGWFGGYSLTYGSLAGVMIALLFFFMIGLGVVMGAELNAALAEGGATALKGEVYAGPYTDELDVEEPEPGEDVEAELETGGPQL